MADVLYYESRGFENDLIARNLIILNGGGEEPLGAIHLTTNPMGPMHISLAPKVSFEDLRDRLAPLGLVLSSSQTDTSAYLDPERFAFLRPHCAGRADSVTQYHIWPANGLEEMVSTLVNAGLLEKEAADCALTFYAQPESFVNVNTAQQNQQPAAELNT